MKQKTIFAILSLLMLSLSSFAQAPVKGDVNEDGKVYEDDISAIIEIIKNGQNQPTYYWYVGIIQPTDPTDTEQNSGLNKWTSLGTTLPTSDIQVNKVDTSYNFSTWYIAAPSAAIFTLYNATNVASDEATWNKTTFNVGSVQYTLWTSKATSYQAVEYLHK